MQKWRIAVGVSASAVEPLRKAVLPRRIHVKIDNMGWSRQGGGGGRRGYHHGNLREALIEAALNMIAEKGPAGFTIADAARAAGVSAAAPYRHFRDREDLLADVARLGFELFADRLTAAWKGGGADPMRAFEDVGRAYLAFAREEPAYYAAMFEAGIAASATPGLRQASERAFGVLREASEAICATLPKEKRPPAMMMALHVWAFSHGIASLFTGPEGARRSPVSAEELLEAGLLVYFQGLGLVPKPAGG
jgi:AcrR family transcriptional regulator